MGKRFENPRRVREKRKGDALGAVPEATFREAVLQSAVGSSLLERDRILVRVFTGLNSRKGKEGKKRQEGRNKRTLDTE